MFLVHCVDKVEFLTFVALHSFIIGDGTALWSFVVDYDIDSFVVGSGGLCVVSRGLCLVCDVRKTSETFPSVDRLAGAW